MEKTMQLVLEKYELEHPTTSKPRTVFENSASHNPDASKKKTMMFQLHAPSEVESCLLRLKPLRKKKNLYVLRNMCTKNKVCQFQRHFFVNLDSENRHKEQNQPF